MSQIIGKNINIHLFWPADFESHTNIEEGHTACKGSQLTIDLRFVKTLLHTWGGHSNTSFVHTRNQRNAKRRLIFDIE